MGHAQQTFADPPSMATLRRHAQARPDDIAVLDSRLSRSFGQLRRDVESQAQAFRAHGIGAGSRVLFLPDVCIESVIAYHALRAVDAVIVVGDPGTREADRRYYVDKTKATHALLGVRAADTAPPPASVFCFVLQPEGDGLRRWMPDEERPVLAADALGDRGTDAPAVILFSSGTTGRPKAIVHSAATVTALHETLKATWKLSPQDRVLGALPFHTIYGLVFSAGSALHTGAALILMERFHPRLALQAIERHGVTTAAFVPTMALMILNLDDRSDYDLSSLRAVYTASAPISEHDIERFSAFSGAPLISNYGMTEIPGAAVERADASHRRGSVGRICPGFEAVARDDEGRPLPPGQTGEITLRGPTMMQGYLNDLALTAERIRDGWIHTQDIGRVDADGHISLSGRTSDMIMRGGLNIAPLEIEAVLSKHEAVVEAAVVGQPDHVFGQLVVACIVVRAGTDPATVGDVLRDHCAALLPSAKVPSAFHLFDTLPRNAGGKVLRKELAKTIENAAAAGGADNDT